MKGRSPNAPRWLRTGKPFASGGQARLTIVTDTSGERQGLYALKELTRAYSRDRMQVEILTTKSLFAGGGPVLEIVDDFVVSEHDARQAWYVAPYIAGGSLRSRVRSSDCCGGSEESALEMLSDIINAVSFLHDRSVAHRDLKPDNILVRPDGRSILCDLGISLAFAEGISDDRLTRRFEQVGSRHYMPKEAFAGGRMEPAAYLAFDIYAVGKIAYELFAGSTLPGFESHRKEAYDLTRRDGAIYPLLNRLLDGLLDDSPRVRSIAWLTIDSSITAIRHVLTDSEEEPSTDHLDRLLSVASSAVISPHKSATRPIAYSTATQTATDICERTLSWIHNHDHFKRLKDWASAVSNLGAIRSVGTGIGVAALLEGPYIRSDYGLQPLVDRGWERFPSVLVDGGVSFESSPEGAFGSFWLVFGVGADLETVRAYLGIIIKGRDGTIDFDEKSLRLVTGGLYDLAVEENLRIQLDELIVNWALAVAAAAAARGGNDGTN